MVLSSWTSTPVSEVAQAGQGGLQWFQLYVLKDRQLTKELVKGVERAGFKALVLTVDTPTRSRRLADIRNQFRMPKHVTFAAIAQLSKLDDQHSSELHHFILSMVDSTLSWATVDWLRSVTSLPIVLKGILTAEDALEALKHDIQGILVSNHGGRKLDGVLAAVMPLPFILSLSFSFSLSPC